MNARLVQYPHYLFTPNHIPHKLKEPLRLKKVIKIRGLQANMYFVIYTSEISLKKYNEEKIIELFVC